MFPHDGFDVLCPLFFFFKDILTVCPLLLYVQFRIPLVFLGTGFIGLFYHFCSAVVWTQVPVNTKLHPLLLSVFP